MSDMLTHWAICDDSLRLMKADARVENAFTEACERQSQVVRLGACTRGGGKWMHPLLAEAIRLGTGPLGIVLARPDPILTVASLVAQSLYGVRCPVVVCAIDGFATGDRLQIFSVETGAACVEVLSRSM